MPQAAILFTTDGWLMFDTLRPAIEKDFEAFWKEFERDLLPSLKHKIKRLNQAATDPSVDVAKYDEGVRRLEDEVKGRLSHFKKILHYADKRLAVPESIRSTRERRSCCRYETYKDLASSLAKGIAAVEESMKGSHEMFSSALSSIKRAKQQGNTSSQRTSTGQTSPAVSFRDDKTENDSDTQAERLGRRLPDRQANKQQDLLTELIEQQLAQEHRAWQAHTNDKAVSEYRAPTRDLSPIRPSSMDLSLKTSFFPLLDTTSSPSTRSSSIQSQDSSFRSPPSSRTSLSSDEASSSNSHDMRRMARLVKAKQEAEIARAEAKHDIESSLRKSSLEARVEAVRDLKHDLETVYEARADEILAIPRRPKIWDIRKEETEDWKCEVQNCILRPMKELSDEFGDLLLIADASTTRNLLKWKERIAEGAQDVSRYARVLFDELEAALEDGAPEDEGSEDETPVSASEPLTSKLCDLKPQTSKSSGTAKAKMVHQAA